MVLTASQKSSCGKAYLFLSLVIPTIASAALFGLTLSNTYVGHGLKTWVLSNRAPIQIVVQVLSTLIGACQIYALSTSIRFWTNTYLSTTPISLDTLKLLDAITTARLDLDVPTRALTILLVYLTTIQVPAALWAGAFTPIFTNTNATAQYIIPQYSNSSQSLWGRACAPATRCDEHIGNNSQLGTFTYIAWKGIVLPTSVGTLI